MASRMVNLPSYVPLIKPYNCELSRVTQFKYLSKIVNSKPKDDCDMQHRYLILIGSSGQWSDWYSRAHATSAPGCTCPMTMHMSQLYLSTFCHVESMVHIDIYCLP